jgi:Zn-dependent protease/predicted transcriptional regulator
MAPTASSPGRPLEGGVMVEAENDRRRHTMPGVRGGFPGGGVRLGRIAGVEVRLHWTWGIAASLIALGLARGVFPDEVAGLSSGTYYAMGVVTAVLFFISLLLHELGHALQARREGIATRGITLWMLGGVAQSAATFDTPGTEARVALAGPAVSAVLGAALVAAGHASGVPDAVAAVLEWLGWTNLLLLAFNLLPALPLDGGRVLRAALWRLRGSQLRATREAVFVSRVLSSVLVALGVVGFLTGAGFSGLWLAFVGWFVMSAASGEAALAETRAALAGMRVGDVMTPDPITIEPSATAAELLELARRTGHTVFPVVDEYGHAVGLVSALSAQRLPERRGASLAVRDLLAEIPDPLLLHAEADVLSAVPALAASPLHRAAVLRAGRLVGVLSLSDVMRSAGRRRRLATV